MVPRLANRLRRSPALAAVFLLLWCGNSSSAAAGAAAQLLAAPVGASKVALANGLGVPRQAPDRLAAKTVTLRPKADSFVSSARPADNFGSANVLSVGERPGYGATRALLYFDLEELARNEVPVRARLRLYLREHGTASDPARDIVVYRLRDGWEEGRVTWDGFPDWSDKREAVTSVGTSRTWYAWDISSLVRGWYVGKWRNQGLYVQGYETAGSYRSFDSREGSNRPQLDLDVEIDRVAPTAALEPLPPFVNTSQLTLRWPEAVDPEPSSLVEYYEVWMQRNEEPWMRLATNLKERSYLVQGLENGRRYRFRVLAVDRAGNRQPEGPAQAEAIVDWSPPVARIDPLPEWVNGPFDLRWSGVDEPSAAGVFQSGIDVFFVEYNINDTAWGPLESEVTHTSLRFAPEDGVAYGFRATARDRAGNLGLASEPVARTRADLRPPSVRFEPASGIDSPTFRVRWTGNDHGGSGIASYDIQYRVGQTGAWVLWAPETRETFRDFRGEYGRWYYFRGRARDIAGNVADYPETPQLAVPVIESSRLAFRCLLATVRR